MNREYVPATLAELWEEKYRQERRRERNRHLLAIAILLGFAALDVYLLWPL